LNRKRILWSFAAAALLALVGWDFVVATTFLGDDYVFRLFGRLEDNPFVAFVADKHGGEYYRPIPMLLWWVLERVADGQVWLFALASFLLHLLCALLLAVLTRLLGLGRRTALLAGVLFFIAPAQREAALWFSASTDLLSVAALLGSLATFLAGGRWRLLSVLLAAVAFFSKETALVLPALLFAAAWFRARQRGEAPSLKDCLVSAVPHLAVAVLYLGARLAVLRGVGGSGDPMAPWFAWGLQLGAGMAHAVTAYAPLPEWLALLAGGVILVAVAFVGWRRSPLARFALVFVALALLPLPAAGWVVGARYFYLPAAGLFLLVAVAIESASHLLVGTAVACLLCLGLLSGGHRADEVRQYRQAVAAADAAVQDGLSHGHQLFFVRGGVKDLDLALKLFPHRPQPRFGYVVLPDVPASFVWLPHELAEQLAFVLAQPPLPPSGAYHFGGERIVGQARREESPALDEVMTRLPDLRIIHVRRQGSYYHWEDRTDDYRR
jgi:hypothetical protein